VFAANGLFNVVWSMIFFTVRRPDWAFFEVPLLWLSVLLGVMTFWRGARTASYYLLPYLVWVSFAAYLNWTVVRLNAPFA
jgi:translocator protein